MVAGKYLPALFYIFTNNDVSHLLEIINPCGQPRAAKQTQSIHVRDCITCLHVHKDHFVLREFA